MEICARKLQESLDERLEEEALLDLVWLADNEAIRERFPATLRGAVTNTTSGNRDYGLVLLASEVEAGFITPEQVVNLMRPKRTLRSAISEVMRAFFDPLD